MTYKDIALIELSDPNPDWPKKFEEIKKELGKVMGEYAVFIEHIGSTAIPHLSAKPEIDILVGLHNLKDIEKLIEPLKVIGYPYYRRFEEFVPERRYFRKSEGIKPLVHVHMYEVNSESYKNHLLFRNYMRGHSDAVNEYEHLKKGLLKSSGGDRSVYQDGKVEFIKRIVQIATEELS